MTDAIENSFDGKYIQINIYGKTLQELESNGVNLNAIMDDIGCYRFWITEGNLLQHESSITSENSINDETIPIFSTTVADIKFPRSSTPRNSLNRMSRKFTIGATKEISVIKSAENSDTEVFDRSLNERDYGEYDTPMENGIARILSSIIRSVENNQLKENSRSINSNQNLSTPTTKSSSIGNKERKIYANSSKQIPAPSILKKNNRSVEIEGNTSIVVFSDLVPVNLDRSHAVNDNYYIHTPNYYREFKPSFENIEYNSSYQVLDDVPHDFDRVADLRNDRKTEREMNAIQEEYENDLSMMLENYNNNNDVHIIRCQFENCKKTYKWKRKYGKLRLVNHVLTHTGINNLNCHDCTFSCRSITQMRYHYVRKHPKTKINGYGMKNSFGLSNEVLDIKNLWSICYQDNLHVVGKINSERMRRNKKTSINI